jgi:hypothetical protein
MNAFDLSLEIIIVGVRGAGKTLLMTHFECEALSRAWALKKLREATGKQLFPKQKVNVWSNYPVKALWQPKQGMKAILLESNPLDIERLITWEEEFHDGIIFFDEIDQVADRQDWYSTVAKFLTAGVQVMRHRNLSLILSIQSLEWLNARLQWQADIIIKCRDLAFTPWGKENHVGLGEVINTTWLDKSGIMTGSSFEERKELYQQQFLGKRYFNAYKTTHEFDITANKTKYRVLTPQKVIDMTGETERAEKNKEALQNTIEYLIYNNTEWISSADLWLRAAEFGFDGEPRKYGQELSKMGVQRKATTGGIRYLLEGVKLNA